MSNRLQAPELNVNQPQVYALVRSGELPTIKLGSRGVWRVDRRQLEDYIEPLLRGDARVGQGPSLKPEPQRITIL